LPVAAGGTGQTTQQAAMNALAGTQTANRVLRSNGTNTTLSQVALATDVSGTLAVANGGTNLTTFGAANRALYSTGTTTLTAGTLPVLAGGTGTASPSLVAGTNVTISGSWPNQTVNASGGGSPAAPTAAGIVFGKTDGSVLITSLGYGAGCFAQGNCTVAIGAYAGSFTQGQKAIAIGFQAGDGLQGDQAIAIGYKAGYLSCAGQPTQSIVIAADAGAFGITATGPNQTHISPIRNVCSTSGLTSLFYNATTKEIVQAAGGGGASCATPYCVGVVYGRTQCGAGSGIPPTAAVSLGFGAGCGSSGTGSVAIGQYAAYCSQGTQAVAIGPWAACSCQGSYAVAIGNFAACSGQGSYAVAIGNFAGGFSQPANSIAIGNLTVPTGTNRTHIGPIRSASSPFYLYYCPCTREITYST
jgi:hypothetical protein